MLGIKSIVAGGVTLAFGAGALLAGQAVFAYQGNPAVQGPNYSIERHEAMEKAFETKNYQEWKKLMGDRGATRFINEGNFSKFAEAHRLAEEGKVDEANKLRAELGLGQGQGRGQGGNGQGRGLNGGGCGMSIRD